MLRRRLLGGDGAGVNQPDQDGDAAAGKAEHNEPSSSTRRNDITTISNEEERHENLAGELLKLTSQMKDNFKLAGSVLKEDNMSLGSMQSLSDANRTNLVREGKRLHHHAYKSCFDCIMFLTVILVIWTFIAMILVMRVFPKRA